jgi:hypothetical protein
MDWPLAFTIVGLAACLTIGYIAHRLSHDDELTRQVARLIHENNWKKDHIERLTKRMDKLESYTLTHFQSGIQTNEE